MRKKEKLDEECLPWAIDMEEEDETILFKCIDCGEEDEVPDFIVDEYSYDLKKERKWKLPVLFVMESCEERRMSQVNKHHLGRKRVALAILFFPVSSMETVAVAS